MGQGHDALCEGMPAELEKIDASVLRNARTQCHQVMQYNAGPVLTPVSWLLHPMIPKCKAKACNHSQAKDAFYLCVDKEASQTQPTDQIPTACRKTRAEFEKHCKSSWVSIHLSSHPDSYRQFPFSLSVPYDMEQSYLI